MKTAEVGDVNWKYEAPYYQISILLWPSLPPLPLALLWLSPSLIRIYKCPTLEIRAILSRQISFTSLHFLLEKIGSKDSEFNQFVIFYQWYFQPWYVILSPQILTINDPFITFTGMFASILLYVLSKTMIHGDWTFLYRITIRITYFQFSWLKKWHNPSLPESAFCWWQDNGILQDPREKIFR